MKVVHFSTSVGEASANIKLQRALQKEGVESLTIVKSCSCADGIEGVMQVQISMWGRVIHQLHKKWARFILKRYNLPEGIPFSLGKYGIDVAKIKAVEEADILHIHWICDFLSPKIIAKLVETGKPVVWTCHDSWAFTGGCHVRLGCKRYETGCGECPILNSICEKDISDKIVQYKKKYFSDQKIAYVAPSNWMGECIRSSLLFRNKNCVVIPNPLDSRIYSAKSPKEILYRLQYKKDSNKYHILFAANDVDIPYKGFLYFQKMLDLLKQKNEEMANKVVLHLVGAHDDSGNNKIPPCFKSIYWGYINDQYKLASLYSMADVLVFPSIDDNLPSMVMECLACETPVVAFNTGGISDMIEHKKNGYIAQYKDSGDLLNGLMWVIENNKDNCLGVNGRIKVTDEFNDNMIARQHIDLYKSLLVECANKAGKGSKVGK